MRPRESEVHGVTRAADVAAAPRRLEHLPVRVRAGVRGDDRLGAEITIRVGRAVADLHALRRVLRFDDGVGWKIVEADHDVDRRPAWVLVRRRPRGRRPLRGFHVPRPPRACPLATGSRRHVEYMRAHGERAVRPRRRASGRGRTVERACEARIASVRVELEHRRRVGRRPGRTAGDRDRERSARGDCRRRKRDDTDHSRRVRQRPRPQNACLADHCFSLLRRGSCAGNLGSGP